MSKLLFLRYISQNIAGMIGLSCYILVDTWFVSLALGTSGVWLSFVVTEAICCVLSVIWISQSS